MRKKPSVTAKIIELSNELPEFCSSFLLESGTSLSVETRRAYAYELIWFFDYLISYNPHFAELERTQIQISDLYQITTSDINRYTSILSETSSPPTVARKKSAISAFFNFMSSGTGAPLNFNPVLGSAKVKIPENEDVIYLTIEEQNTLIDCVKYGTGLEGRQLTFHEKYKKRDLAILLLFLDTGMRVSELNGLDIADIDLDDCSAFIYRKRDKMQTVYFSDEAKGYIEDYLLERKTKFSGYDKDEPLFTTAQGKRLAVRSIEAMVEKYAKASLGNKADLISPHKLRSSFAMTYYPASNHDLLALKDELGHSTFQATKRYAAATKETLRNNRQITANARSDKRVFDNEREYHK